MQVWFSHAGSHNHIHVGPAPKLSRTPGQLPDVIIDLHPGQHTIEVLQEIGYPQKVIAIYGYNLNNTHVYTVGN